MNNPSDIQPVPDAVCAECNTPLNPGDDRVTTDGGVFCRNCYATLTAQLQHALEAQGRDINYPMAFAGALGGAALGVAVWWGFTIATGVAFGLVAIVIGFTTAKGMLMLSGHKRSPGLQILSVTVAALGYVYATYLVNRTFLQKALAEDGQDIVLPFVPGPELLFRVVQAGFGVMDLVFLAIVVYEAWRIPAPIALRANPPA